MNELMTLVREVGGGLAGVVIVVQGWATWIEYKRNGELLAKLPGAQVVGHRDLGATQCPGFDVRSWRAAANARPPVIDSIPARPLPSPATPVATGPAKGAIYILATLAAAALAFFGVK